MKVIMSRKGFDSANGGYPSPIMPDGTLISMPIPSDDEISYGDLQYKGLNYSDLLGQLIPHKEYTHCHLDPDIRDNCRIMPVDNWKAAFGQIGSSQSLLSNAGVEVGDVFLFFGWFRRVMWLNGRYQFVQRNKGGFYDHSDLHVVYGYMQIGEILVDKEEISKYSWHPHSSDSRLKSKTNAIYLPTSKLSLLPELPGYGTLDYRNDRVLTKENRCRGTWNKFPFLMPEHVYGVRKNSAKDDGLYYNGIWQELVVYESEGLIKWVESIIQ